jgi:3-oxoacyl-[acyl-carrier-protein] synthase II
MGRFAHLAVAASTLCMKDAGIELTDEDRGSAAPSSAWAGRPRVALSPLGRAPAPRAPRRSARTSSRGHREPRRGPGRHGARAAWAELLQHQRVRLERPLARRAASSGSAAVAPASCWPAAPRRRSRASASAASAPCSRSPDATTRPSARAARGTRAATASSARGRGVAAARVAPPREEARRAIYAEVTGYGASCDAYHITKPAPDGRGRAARDEDGPRDARVAPDAPSATSTPTAPRRPTATSKRPAPSPRSSANTRSPRSSG